MISQNFFGMVILPLGYSTLTIHKTVIKHFLIIKTKGFLITLVNKKIFFSSAKDILKALGYSDVAESENYIVFSELALVFEISVFFIFGKRKIVNFCIC